MITFMKRIMKARILEEKNIVSYAIAQKRIKALYASEESEKQIVPHNTKTENYN